MGVGFTTGVVVGNGGCMIGIGGEYIGVGGTWVPIDGLIVEGYIDVGTELLGVVGNLIVGGYIRIGEVCEIGITELTVGALGE